MSLPTLPVELIDNIIQNVFPTDLVAISRTCSALCPVALRFLYRHISVSHWSCNINVVATLAERPDLAHCVRSFSITTSAFSHYHLLANALSSMTEIVSLNLLIDSSASWVLKNNVTYHQLQQFTCTFPLDSIVAEFLGNTPALLQLQIDSIPCMPHVLSSLPTTAIPHLVHFIGSAHAARAIVPGRPVESIHLNEGDLAEEDIASLAQASADVLLLGATASTPPVPLLESIARHLPHLVYLRITTTYHFTHAPAVGFMEQVANALAALPDLSTFELSGMHWGSSTRGDDGNKRVWQSAPLGNTFNRSEEVAIDSEIFLQY